MINLIIWGIRDGFEERLFNLNDVPADFQVIPRDALFRSLSNKVRPSTYFVISRTRNLNVFTLIDTEITEYNRTAQRPGFVAFSFVLGSNSFFAESPMNVLKGFVEFYKSRVGDGKLNNFTREEAAQFVSQLKTENRGLGVQDEKCYGYFNSISEVEELFVGATSYATYSELILFPEQSSHSITELFKERGGGFKLVNLGSEKSKEQDKKSRAKLAEQQEREIYDVFVNGDKDQAYQAYVNSPYRSLFSQNFSHVLNEFHKGITDQRNREFQRAQDKTIEARIIKAIQSRDGDEALRLFETLSTHQNLEPSTMALIEPYRRNRQSQIKIQRDAELHKKRKKEEKDRNRKMLIVASSVGVIIGLGMISFFLKVPADLYNSPVAVTVSDTIPPKANDKPQPGKEKELSEHDKIMKGDTLFAGSHPNNPSLDSSFVYYIKSKKEWWFCKERTGEYGIVKEDISKDSLRSKFVIGDEPNSTPPPPPSPSASTSSTGNGSNRGGGNSAPPASGNEEKKLSGVDKTKLDNLYNELIAKASISQDDVNGFSSTVKAYKDKGFDVSSYKRKETALRNKL